MSWKPKSYGHGDTRTRSGFLSFLLKLSMERLGGYAGRSGKKYLSLLTQPLVGVVEELDGLTRGTICLVYVVGIMMRVRL